MKKNLLYILFTLFLSFGFNLKAQSYWISPINGVPFEVTYENPNSPSDSTIINFAGDTTYIIDTAGVKIWNPISDAIFQAIFGYDAPDITTITNPQFDDYYDLLVVGIQPADTNYWDITGWDTLIVQSPWMFDRTINLTSANMGALVSWDWYNMDFLSAKIILDPTVPVIEGEDMDYIVLDGTTNMAFDIEDFKTNAEEIQASLDYEVHTFNKPDFKDVYNDFVQWMKDTKPFYPNSFDFNTYHDWLYEYFHPIALDRIATTLTTYEYHNQISLIKVSDNVYQISGEKITDNSYSIFDRQGKKITSGKLIDGKVFIDSMPKGLYLLDVIINNQHSVHKIMK